MDVTPSFGNVSSGAFFSDYAIHNENQSILDQIICGFNIKEEAYSYRSKSDLETVPHKNNPPSSILWCGHVFAINDCLDKLDILRLTMRQIENSKWYDDFQYRSPEKRFYEDLKQLDNEDYSMYEYTNMRKLAKEVCRIYSILSKTLKEFKHSMTAESLHKTVSMLELQDVEVEEFLDEYEGNRLTLCGLVDTINNSQNLNKQRYVNTTNELIDIEQQYEDLMLFSEIQMKYVNSWENHREHLNTLFHDREEKALSNLIEEYKQKMEFDTRAHLEICNYMHFAMVNMQGQIDYWMEEYDQKLEKIDGDIYAMNVTREKLGQDLDNMRKEYEMRSHEIQEWLDLKELLRKQRELEEHMCRAATKIQAWWRGVMVRRKLGPYRRKKKGKKGNAKKKSKKIKKSKHI